MSSKQGQFSGTPGAATFTAPGPGDVYWGEVVTLTVSITGLKTDLVADDYVQFGLDPLFPADPTDPENHLHGIKAVDPTLENGKVLVTPGADSRSGTATLEVYVDGQNSKPVKFVATFSTADTLTSFPVTEAPKVTINAAEPGFDYISPNRVLAANNPNDPAATPQNSPQNFFRVSYTPRDVFGTELSNRVFVAYLKLTTGINKAHQDIDLEQGLNNLLIYPAYEDAPALTIDTTGPHAGTRQLVRSSAAGLFDLYICAKNTVLFGNVHLDLIGQDTSSGTLIVTDVGSADSGIPAPWLSNYNPDVSNVASINGSVPFTKGISVGSQYFVLLSSPNAQKRLVPQLVASYTLTESSIINFNKNSFGLPMGMLNLAQGVIPQNTPTRYFVTYLTLTTEGVTHQSSFALLDAWRSDQSNVPVDPPVGSPSIAAPTFVGTTAQFPNRVTPAMCVDGLKIILDWSETPFSQQPTENSDIYVQLMLTGWSVDTTLPLAPKLIRTNPVKAIPDEPGGTSMTVTLTPQDTAGYRNDLHSGALGTITATYWYNTQEPRPNNTSQTVIDQFYSAG